MLEKLFKDLEKEIDVCIKLRRPSSTKLETIMNIVKNEINPPSYDPFDNWLSVTFNDDSPFGKIEAKQKIQPFRTKEEIDQYNKYRETINKLRGGELFKKPTVICSRSGEQTDDFVIVDGQFVSRSMLTDNDFFCSHCNEYHNTMYTPIFNTVGGGQICERVARFYYSRCNQCGLYEQNEEMRSMSYRSGDVVCRECYNKIAKYSIKSYHNTPTLVGYEYNENTQKNDQVSMENFKGYGIELEIDNGGEDNITSKDIIQLLNDEVYTMHDGSINNGFEIITHPHTEDALYNMNWAETFKWLLKKGYRSHDVSTCGLHMHISRTLFKDANAICKMMYFYEKFRYDVIRMSRRTSDRVDRWAGFYLSPAQATRKNIEDVFLSYNGGGHSSRYKCVNLTNRNTIEIRIMKGTLRLETFLATLDFIITVAKNANNISWEDINNQELWLKGLKDSTVDYLISRKAFKGDTSQRTNSTEPSEQSIVISDDEIEVIKFKLEEINKQCV